MKVGCAAVFQNQELLKRLPNKSSVNSAEAIVLAMNIITNPQNLSSIQTPNQFYKLYRAKIQQLLSSQDY